jgi:1-acyl-sn-glycerol-3-phosphate acyltransferase
MVVSIVGYYASQIHLEEDITKVLPSDNKVSRINQLLQDAAFLDKMVFTISLKDTNQINIEALQQYADTLASKLKMIDSALIRNVTYKVEDDLMYTVYDVFLNNIPIFLNDADYATLDKLITSEKIDTTLQKNYKTLLSPASPLLKRNILKDPIGITPYALKRLQSLQFDDNFESENGYILTKDKKHLMLFVNPAIKASDNVNNKLLLSDIDSIIANCNAQFNQTKAEYFASNAVALGNAERIKKDVILTLSITVVALFLLLTYFFKRAYVFVLIFLPVLFGAGFSLAIIYVMKGSISAIALGAGSIVLGVAIDYSIHFYTHFKHTHSIKLTVKDLSVPLTMGSSSTIGAFLSLLFVKSEALQDLGLFAAFSLIGAALFTLLVFPHLLKERKEIDTTILKPNLIERLAAYKYENNKWLLYSILLLCVVSLFSSQRVGFEGDMMKMNYISKELSLAEKNLNSISNISLKTIYVISEGDNLEEALKQNEAIIPQLEQLKANNKIKQYSSINTVFPSWELQIKRIAKWKQYWTAEKIAMLKANLIAKSSVYKFKATAFDDFYESLEKNYYPIDANDFGESKDALLSNFISTNKNKQLVITPIKTTSENEDEVVNELEQNKNAIVFDKKNLTNQFVAIIKNNFNLILGISSLLVLVILIIAYGRFELALVTYLPMMMSWLIILGLMGLFGIKFNIINIIISTFIFGLGDDYSIFITDALINEYKTGEKNLDSFKSGIFLSAFTTMIGIGVLAFAKHPALQSIGIITIIGMLAVLIVSNTIQPLLFRFFITKRTNKKQVPFTLLSLAQSVFAYTWFVIGCFSLIPLGFIIVKLLPLPKASRMKLFHHLRCTYTKSMIFVHLHVRKKYINELNEKLSKPAMVVVNHHSVIDSLLLQSLNPKLILMVNDWVWNSATMGPIVRLGGFIPKSAGYEENLDTIQKLIDDGYSIGIFPEGSRSESPKIGRFHKGAFYIAERLHLDILPIIFHGTAFVQGVDDSFLLKPGKITVKYLPRIAADDNAFGNDYNSKTKLISKYFKAEYNKLRQEIETVDYYFNRISKNYIYKGPILEWYMRIKVKLEDNYRLFESLLPKKGTITDIGCGYGFLPYMLSFMSEDRIVIGTDYDEEKIAVANNCFSKNDRMNFFAADVTICELPQSDAFILSDILHYLPKVKQELLLVKCMNNLNNGGMILMRDADASLKARHKGTRYTEFISTKFGFNKTQNKLEFVTFDFIESIVNQNNFQLTRIDNTKLTSNITYVIKRQ